MVIEITSESIAYGFEKSSIIADLIDTQVTCSRKPTVMTESGLGDLRDHQY